MAEQTTDRAGVGSIDRVSDVVESVQKYARQETVEPLKGAVRWVFVGTLGATCLGLAVIFASLAALRLAQDLGGASLEGGLSFVPYLVAAAVLAVFVVITLSRVSRRSLQKGEWQ